MSEFVFPGTTVILAGGLGSRVAGRYPDLPKPLIEAAGRPFLYWVTLSLADAGARDIVYATGHLGDMIENWVSGPDLPRDIRRRCHREDRPLGTAGAVAACLDMCAETLLVANGDSLIAKPLRPAIERFMAGDLDGVVVGARVVDASRYGTLATDADGLLTGFAEKQPGHGIVNGGVYLLRKSLLASFRDRAPLSLEYDLFPEALADGARLGVVCLDGDFIDIGTPRTVVAASDFIDSHRARFDAFERRLASAPSR